MIACRGALANACTSSGIFAGCDTPGFYAAEGWDPVTGMGSPDFEKFVAAAMQL